jgi:hypothetical protein
MIAVRHGKADCGKEMLRAFLIQKLIFDIVFYYLDRAEPLKFTLFEDRAKPLKITSFEDRAEPLKNFE